MRPFVIFAACACMAACDDGLPAVTKIDDFRVLAVRAEPPEVPPGGIVALDALIAGPTADPAGQPAATMTWYACLMTEEGGGFFGGGSETATSGGEGTPLSSDPYGGSCAARALANERFTWALGEGPTATWTAPADFFATDEVVKIAYGLSEDVEIPPAAMIGFLGIAGVNVTVALVTERADGQRLETQKRVNVSTESLVPDNARNGNPSNVALSITKATDNVTPPVNAPVPPGGACFTDEALVLTPGERYHLDPVNVPSPQAPYAVLLAGTTTNGEPFEVRTVEETYFYSVFATVGSLAKEVSKAPGEPRNTWKIGKSATGVAEFWAVVRDGRGGVGWCHSRLPIGSTE